ncbi:MAG: ribose-5-phosphate isomerase [Planctomycetes bacterium GWF2_41_51]|nr:MAG: ribose-5-phosphate isomerase [Planctomycetes bacterium GWF2_41_51]HBG25574.1 ribose-5-phosphate isomerase [Phycisphaerales bacterium]
MRIAIDCDDAGIELKKTILSFLKSKGADAQDVNCLQTNPSAMYPEIGFNLAEKVKNGEFDRGILICGTGLGMAIAANKVEGIYAGVCHDVFSAERLRKSNNAQILTLGARVIGPELAKTIVQAWLDSEFLGGTSLPKIEQMKMLERKSFHPIK